MIKFCPTCRKNNSTEWGCVAGYFWGLRDDICTCLVDGTEMINIDFPARDMCDLGDISKDNTFIDAMINLYQTDIIEYELKISQFRQQVEGQKHTQDNRPKCPTCHSTNIAKIDGLERASSIAVFGLFSKKINKSFKCKNCGHTW